MLKSNKQYLGLRLWFIIGKENETAYDNQKRHTCILQYISVAASK